MIHKNTLLKMLWVILPLLFLMNGVFAQPNPPVTDGDFEVRLWADDRDEKPRQGPFQIVGLDDRPTLKNKIEEMAFESRRIIQEKTHIDWLGTALIVWTEDEGEFLKKTGKRPEHIAAAASARRLTIWINGQAWTRQAQEERQKTLTHELGHLLVGNLPGGRDIPLWAEEGLVQHLAGQASLQQSMALSQARFVGQLPHLADLESSFPDDPKRQELAYATSYKAIEVIAETHGPGDDGIGRLIRRLADKSAGPEYAEELWDKGRRDGWNQMINDSVGSRWLNGVIVLSSHTAVWVLVIFLVVVAYIAVRRRRAQMALAYEEREAWRESLTEGDVQDVWGDREGRFGEVETTPWDASEEEREAEADRWKLE